MEGGETKVPRGGAGPCAEARMEVWPPPELAGSAGQGHGCTGRWPADRVTKGQDPSVLGRAPNSGLLLTGRGTPARAGRSHLAAWTRT